MANFGHAPYEEAAAQGTARVSMLQRLGQILSGAGQGIAASRNAANPLEAAFTGFSGAYGASQAARQAAEQYAMKKVEADRAEEERQQRMLLMQAQAERAGRPETPQKPEKMDWWNLPPDQRQSYIDSQAALAGATAKATAQYKGNGAAGTGESTPGLSNEALDAAAMRYSITGAMPSMGMGKQAAAYRAEIMNRAGKKYPSANIAANAAEYKKDNQSLTNIQKISDAASSWEDTVNRNADVMLQYINRIPETGTRFGNKVARYVASQTGSPAQAAFNSARETIKVEYARLLSSPGIGNAVLSDAARREIEGIISGDLTVSQMRHALSVLRQDATNRLGAYQKKVNDIQKRLRSNPIGAMSTYGGQGQQGQDIEWIMDENGNLAPAGQ